MSNRQYLVGLSAGHYPARPGAGYQGVHEHELALLWVEDIKLGLKEAGVEVVTTKPSRLRYKIKHLNEYDLDLAVEVHFNGSRNPSVAGVETLFCPKSFKGKILADIVHRNYAPTMDNKDRGIKEGWYKMDRPYVIDYPGDIDGDEHPDGFLAKTHMPALILEPDFIAQWTNIQARRVIACEAVVKGILEYLERT